jgi:hypothetical protein
MGLTTEIIELEMPKNIHLNAFYWRNRLNANFGFPEKKSMFLKQRVKEQLKLLLFGTE